MTDSFVSRRTREKAAAIAKRAREGATLEQRLARLERRDALREGVQRKIFWLALSTAAGVLGTLVAGLLVWAIPRLVGG